MNHVVDPRNASKAIKLLESEENWAGWSSFNALVPCRSALLKRVAICRFQRKYKNYRVPRHYDLDDDVEFSPKGRDLKNTLQRNQEHLERQRLAAIAILHNELATAHKSAVNFQRNARMRTRSETLQHAWESTSDKRRQGGDDAIDKLNTTFERLEKEYERIARQAFRESIGFGSTQEKTGEKWWRAYFDLSGNNNRLKQPDCMSVQQSSSYIQTKYRNARASRRQMNRTT